MTVPSRASFHLSRETKDPKKGVLSEAQRSHTESLPPSPKAPLRTAVLGPPPVHGHLRVILLLGFIAVREGLTTCDFYPTARDLLNHCLCYCFQVRGHHIAKLDPLGISCVNFDDAPVTVSSNVGED